MMHCTCLSASCAGEIDYKALIAAIDKMDPQKFAAMDIEGLVASYRR